MRWSRIPRFELGEAQKADLEKYTQWIINHANDFNPDPATRTARIKNKRMRDLIISRAGNILKIIEKAKLIFK